MKKRVAGGCKRGLQGSFRFVSPHIACSVVKGEG
jgi:hypothetical protein